MPWTLFIDFQSGTSGTCFHCIRWEMKLKYSISCLIIIFANLDSHFKQNLFDYDI